MARSSSRILGRWTAMALRKCVFDHDGKVIEWLSTKGYHELVGYRPPYCWVCSLHGEGAAHRLDGHKRCTSRPAPSHDAAELWVIHGDRFHNEWIPIDVANTAFPPLAVLFVSLGGDDNFFADRCVEAVQFQSSRQAEKSKVPIFYHRGGLANNSNFAEFRELLTCSEVALQELEHQTNGDPLEPFRRAALESRSAYWPQAVGFRDAADDLFFLWAAVKLAESQLGMRAVVEGLLMRPSLSLASRRRDDLETYLLHQHGDIFVPLSCQATLARTVHTLGRNLPDTAMEREETLRQLKTGIVAKWFQDNKGAARARGIDMDWLQLKDRSIQDVDKWALRMKGDN